MSTYFTTSEKETEFCKAGYIYIYTNKVGCHMNKLTVRNQ